MSNIRSQDDYDLLGEIKTRWQSIQDITKELRRRKRDIVLVQHEHKTATEIDPLICTWKMEVT